ncbi:DNA repair protein RecN [Leptolyngbya sp. 'hensonii']|uniref:DNA repair protein RecN n=1 Tax=Leptolyngbya sp. 'hensonii' TaxID=1922337 RepID=UPI00094F9915|nr:DNA repair protein RecN [Leptolyngbya sp. 'hensonii']OLP17687.1 DNA repair protein RecN [Leptolyngbya sp. 'hensonii']
MLLSLRIENFALIDRLELEFGSGLHVLTGETGAGKSIILDAIDAVLGGKMTGRAIRTGTERSLIEAVFALEPALVEWLGKQDIDPMDGEMLVCSRELSLTQGNFRSRSRLNGVLVNKQQMEELRTHLVEITAQGQTVQLGQVAIQREWLDSYGGTTLQEQRAIVASAYTHCQQALQILERRRHSEQQRLQQLDLLDYQFRELKEANLQDPEELVQLQQEHQRLNHSVDLQQQSYLVYQALYENETGRACADLLGQAETLLSGMLQYDNAVQPMLDLVSEALAQVQEAGRRINDYGEQLETDPQRLEEVEERIAELKKICRKYGPTLTDALAHYDKLRSQLQDLNGEGQSIEDLEQDYQAKKAVLTEACIRLTQLRQSAAQILETRLVEELKPLAMEKVQFQVEIMPATPASHGADQITFLFSPNPGEPLQPLTAIASGGEMSRFLLALKACFSQVDAIGTMVFDEIDVGVSGRVAQAIAEKLYQLSLQHQVLCVTHQPIVAAMADHHFRVNKETIGDGTGVRGKGNQNGAGDDVRTVVRVRPLDGDNRRQELAQIAGGRTGSEAIAFAESLLVQAGAVRQQHTS